MRFGNSLGRNGLIRENMLFVKGMSFIFAIWL